MKIFILFLIAMTVQADSYVIVRNYNNTGPRVIRARRKTRHTIMARNTFTLNALTWSKAHGGWTHKIYDVTGANRYWNMTNLKPDLMKAYKPTRSSVSYSSGSKATNYFIYVPAYSKSITGQTNPPSYYMQGGTGYNKENK